MERSDVGDAVGMAMLACVGRGVEGLRGAHPPHYCFRRYARVPQSATDYLLTDVHDVQSVGLLRRSSLPKPKLCTAPLQT